MHTTIQRHPALQILLLAIAAVAVLYLGTAVAEFLAAAAPSDLAAVVDAGRRGAP